MISNSISYLILNRLVRSLPIRKKDPLRNEVLQQRIGRVLEDLCIAVLNHDYEKAMASFTTFVYPKVLFLQHNCFLIVFSVILKSSKC